MGGTGWGWPPEWGVGTDIWNMDMASPRFSEASKITPSDERAVPANAAISPATARPREAVGSTKTRNGHQSHGNTGLL